MTLQARFTVDGFEPRQVSGLDAPWVAVLTFAKTFTAGVVGTGTTLFLSAGPNEGERGYVATELITGRLEGGAADGSLVVQHGGLESAPETWFGHIVPGTGTGPFTGWRGQARIEHDAAGAYFAIDLAE